MFKFTQTNEYADNSFPSQIEMTFQSESTWPEVLDGFQRFLVACGYVFPLGSSPTIIDEDGTDLRAKAEELWEKYAKGEENANPTPGY
jgi:hypothetical protein